MPLVPIKGDKPYQLAPGETKSFTLETTVLASVKAIFNPVLRCYNNNSEDIELRITHNLNMGTVGGSDPLTSMSFSLDVVDEVVPSGTFRDYNFGGIQLDNDEELRVTHTITLINNGANTNTVHVLLYGMAEVETQLPAGQEIIRF